MSDDSTRQPESTPTGEAADPPRPRRKAPPAAPPPLPKAANAFAAKARDLEALRAAVVDAAGIGAGLWFSYLFVLLYLFIAVGSVMHKDLFFQSPIRLPFLNIELPLLGFFALGPLLFLVVHGYVLLHFVLLAGKVGAFHTELKALDTPPEIHEDLRRQLPSNLFVQILAGPREVRRGAVGFLLRLVAQFSLVLGPVALLSFFLLQFLPYHHGWITGWHRVALAADLILLWLLWPSVASGRVVRLRELRGVTAVGMAAVSLFLQLSAVTVATFPGETLHEWPSRVQVPIGRDKAGAWLWRPLSDWQASYGWLIGGTIDFDTEAPRSLWSNRLILPGLDVIDHAKFDTVAKIAGLPKTVSLRKRDLRGAVLIRAVLGKADLTAAQLQDASLDEAQLQGASLEVAQLQGAKLNGAQLQGASLNGAQLQGGKLNEAQLQDALLNAAQLQDASLDAAQLQGTSLIGAQLQGASLYRAQLQGALLKAAQLQGASLDEAQLQGASLIGAQLQCASLDRAQLQGASLIGAELQGASLDEAQLQGASLIGAQLQGASLAKISRWKTDLRSARFGPTRVAGASIAPLSAEFFKKIKDSILARRRAFEFIQINDIRNFESRFGNSIYQTIVFERKKLSSDSVVSVFEPNGHNQSISLNTIEDRLNPNKALPEEGASEKVWADLTAAPFALDTFVKAVVDQWRIIGCRESGSPFVLRALLQKSVFTVRSYTSDRGVSLVIDVIQFSKMNSEETAWKPHLAALAKGFLADDCAGARGLTDDERARLKARPWENAVE